MHHSRRSCWACTKIRKVEHRYPYIAPEQNMAENHCGCCDLTSAYCKCDELSDLEDELAWMAGEYCAAHEQYFCFCKDPRTWLAE